MSTVRSGLAAWRLSRAGELPENPVVWSQRVNAFTSGVLLRRGSVVSFVVTRDEVGLSPFVVADDSGPAGPSVRHLAEATGAVAERQDGLPALFTGDDPRRVSALLAARPSPAAGKSVQAGADPGEVSRRLAAGMPAGSWVAVTFRSPSRAELRRVRAWFRHRLGAGLPQHYVSDQQLVIASFAAGAGTRSEVRGLLSQVASAVPGFDVEHRVVFGAARGAQAGGAAVAAALAVAGGAALHAPVLDDVAAAGGALLYGAGSLLGWLPPGRRGRVAGGDVRGLRVPPRRVLRPSAPRLESTRPVRGRDGFTTSRVIAERAGDYPLARAAFAVSPSMIAGLVAPQAGTASGESRTARREVPAPMRDRIGPGIGLAGPGAGVLVHLPLAVEEGSVFCTGRAGSGKTLLAQAVYGWHCRDRVIPSGVRGSTGARNSLIVFESAGPGALDWKRWAEEMGDEAAMIELAAPSSAVIDMLAIPGLGNRERALAFVNALVYCFGDDAIGNRSFDTLKQVIEAGLAITPEIAASSEMLAGKLDPVFAGSPLYYAHVLLGRFGDAVAVDLAAAVAAAAAASPDDLVLKSASEALDPLFGQRTMAQRRDFVDAPRNKIGPLLDSGTWFAPQSGRVQLTWADVIGGHRNVILNMGSASDGTGVVADDSVTTMMLSLLMHTMNREVRRSCAGWQAAGRAVTIFSDELSHVTAGGEAVIAWGLDQGRKYGVRQVLATQRAEQLPESLRTCMLSFPNAVYLQQSNAEVRGQIARQLTQLDPEMTAETVARLEPYTAIVTATVAGVSLMPVTVRLPYWPGDMAGFCEAQGWQRSAYPPPPARGDGDALTAQPGGAGTECAEGDVPEDGDAGW